MQGIKNKYLKFLIKLILLFVIIGVFDQSIGFVLSKLYFKQTSGLFYRTTYVMDSTKADIVIFGSSRANHHYVPQIFADSLKMTCYNAGRDGNFLLFNYATFLSLIKRYTPKVVIFDIIPQDITISPDGYDRLSALLPYYHSHSEVRKTVEMRSTFEKLKLYSKIYPYNSNLLTILMGNTEANKIRKTDHNGYMPLNGSLDSNYRYNTITENLKVDTIAITCLNKIAQICSNKKIKFYLVYSPIYGYQNTSKMDSAINATINQYQITYFNYANDSVFFNKYLLFKDYGHLNNEGAMKFSFNLVQQIKIDYSNK